MKQEIVDKIRAGYPCLYLLNCEDQRTQAEVMAVAADPELNYKIIAWDILHGMVEIPSGKSHGASDPVAALQYIAAYDPSEQGVLFLLQDIHLFMDDPSPDLIATFKAAIRNCESEEKKILISGCRQFIPPELEKDITIIEMGLPDSETREGVLKTLAGECEIELNGNTKPVVRASAGLTTQEATNAFSLSAVKTGAFDPEIIHREKANTLKRNGLLEVIDCNLSLRDIGGLDVATEWIQKRRRVFTPEAREFGIPVPKGVLLAGCPGTGKSLLSKITSKVLDALLLRLDIGSLFGSLVGQSEERVRQVIQTAEAIAPCVLWIDEIEKGFSGTRSSSSTDGGTSDRVFGTFITWMQEKTSSVFIVATANDVTKLPPEMLRKGRFDELFFVDLPTESERFKIWEVLLHKYKRSQLFDVEHLEYLASRFKDYTGAEIEQAIINALTTAFDEDKDIDRDLLATCMAEITPLAKTRSTDITNLRTWAKGKARNASRVDPIEQRARKVLSGK